MSETVSFSKNDIFILGVMHALQALESVKEEGDDMNDIQFEILLENQRRNLENPSIEECLERAKAQADEYEVLK